MPTSGETSKNDRLLQTDILGKAQELIKKLEAGDVGSARALIGNLNSIREDSLFMELGKLTRELHESLKEIDVGVGSKELPNVNMRLDYVIKLTEEASNKTMDGIEQTIPLSDELAKEAKKLYSEWGRFERREMSAAEFNDLYKVMMMYLESVGETADTIHGNLQKVLLAQNYQDLTGQAILKIKNTVSDLEKRLLGLLSITAEAGNVADGDKTTAATAEEAKVEKAKENPEVSGQDEVDDLLSSLGF